MKAQNKKTITRAKAMMFVDRVVSWRDDHGVLREGTVTESDARARTFVVAVTSRTTADGERTQMKRKLPVQWSVICAQNRME